MNKYSPKITKNTLVDYPRLDTIIKLMSALSDTEGAIAEVGVYKGGTAYLICEEAERQGRGPVLLFDTFNGMPDVDPGKDLHNTGDFADTSFEAVSALTEDFSPIIRKGVFPRENSLVAVDKQFVFVHLDVDIYSSVKECLEFFWPKMVQNGVIVLDDYLEPNCPGAKQAADEFANENGCLLIPTTQSQAYLRKY